MDNTNFNKYKLSEEIVRALMGLKYETPTEVQEKVIPVALEGKDMIVQSQTGSGKTASFGIPLCERVIWEENKPQALVLTPTRELAVQIKEDITNIGRFKRIKAVAVFGKQPFSQQQRELKQKTHIVIGTPGRVMDHIKRETLVLEDIKYLIIDEADEMLNMGFIDQVEAIIKAMPRNRITMLFSATVPEDIKRLCVKYMKEPVNIEIESSSIASMDVEHFIYEVKEEDKFKLLKNIMITENPDSSMVFCRTKDQVDNVYDKLNAMGYPCEKLHGGLMQDDRLAVMKDFKQGKFLCLVTTDVAARGIDVDSVNLVINYDIPLEKESYVHRIGRTGRAGKKGKALTFLTPYEDRFLRQIEAYIDFEITKLNVPSKEEVLAAKEEFTKKINKKPKLKKDKSEDLNKGIMKIYFNGGKKKKIRAVDFVGTISNIQGVTAEDIGIIDIQDNISYVEILNGKGPMVLQAMRNTTVKGKQLKVQKARE